jgi:hypothetical protein
LGDNIKMDVGCIRCKIEDLVGLAQDVVHCQVAKTENKERIRVNHREKITKYFRIGGRELKRSDRVEGRRKRNTIES